MLNLFILYWGNYFNLIQHGTLEQRYPQKVGALALKIANDFLQILIIPHA